MRNLRVLSVMAAVGILGLALIGLATSPATAKPATAVPSSSVVVADASTEMALIGAGDLAVQSVTCTKCITDNADCFQSNCGGSFSPNCCCKWCNGTFDCRPRNSPGFCVAE